MISEVQVPGPDFQSLKFLGHSDEEMPNLFLKWDRMAEALAKAVASATFSIERKVVSKRRGAQFKRSFWSWSCPNSADTLTFLILKNSQIKEPAMPIRKVAFTRTPKQAKA